MHSISPSKLYTDFLSRIICINRLLSALAWTFPKPSFSAHFTIIMNPNFATCSIPDPWKVQLQHPSKQVDRYSPGQPHRLITNKQANNHIESRSISQVLTSCLACKTYRTQWTSACPKVQQVVFCPIDRKCLAVDLREIMWDQETLGACSVITRTLPCW